LQFTGYLLIILCALCIIDVLDTSEFRMEWVTSIYIPFIYDGKMQSTCSTLLYVHCADRLSFKVACFPAETYFRMIHCARTDFFFCLQKSTQLYSFVMLDCYTVCWTRLPLIILDVACHVNATTGMLSFQISYLCKACQIRTRAYLHHIFQKHLSCFLQYAIPLSCIPLWAKMISCLSSKILGYKLSFHCLMLETRSFLSSQICLKMMLTVVLKILQGE
jgi:hypothetical protein